MTDDRYSHDVLADFSIQRGPKVLPKVPIERDMVVEVIADGYVGALVRFTDGLMELEDRSGRSRAFPLGSGYLIDGVPVELTKPAPKVGATATRKTASGSFAAPEQRARTALASRIYVEGRHDAELVEKVWGDDLRAEGVVVEFLGGIDDLEKIVADFAPNSERKLGILVDHLVPGSKESRIAEAVGRGKYGKYALIVGHPFVDVWQAVKPQSLGIAAWPTVPRTIEWKHGICEAFGWPHDDQADIARAWQFILSKVKNFGDLEPELLGRVEHLIDFVTVDQES
ncbi:DUF3097 domain-containing protein [Salinibacterium sp. SWN1162]|uniref:DUF3097 domain-containing protein n=1 Tax=Salinibacterium sp. SWN1162 TaxID=2792053 RepID=UPI0018CF0C90|nr:DUF3097 domain-containing protein [Salinibacterium sp. SWN1162]MBH0008985.1 DUF3097 domain-containing protein [Salinibacterium sp. SWN1162]